MHPIVPNTHTCFKCGADTMVPIFKDRKDDYAVDITFSTGYGSEALWDGSTFVFKVCEKCMKEWMLTFKHRPMHIDYMDNDSDVVPATDLHLRLPQ